MKKNIVLSSFIVFVLLFSFGCKGKNDVIVTYKSGTVTRGQFYDWLDANRFPRENILKKKSQQQNKLKKMVLDILAAEEAKKAGYDKSEDYLFLFSLLKPNFYGGYLKKKLTEDATFKEEIAKISMIKLYVKDYKIDKNRRIKLSAAEVQRVVDEKMNNARSIIQELERGGSFSDLAKKYSDDYSKKDGGDIGYISSDMKGPEFSAAAFSLKKGEYTREPVKIGNSIYIIQLNERREVTEDSIEDVVEDKTKAQRMMRAIQRNKSKGIEEKLSKAADVEDHIDLVSSKNPATVLFKIGNDAYTVADLNKLIVYIDKKRKNKTDKSKVDDNIKKQMLQKLFNEKLLYREAIKTGLDKDEAFMNSWKVFEINSLSGAYKSDVLMEGITVTPKEVRDEYDKNKDRLYTRKKKVGGKTVKTVMPFSEVKGRIEYILSNKKKSQKRKEWEDNLFKVNDVKIIESELEGE
ncbi:MAG TPA: peptidylprolyl isomerase [Spirochaetota bacterium]|nr:peptidylprolyl isomerase [Spirochaetota bacterium]HPI89999.1 peptidylprolyl isomerase [Spirochaetota bacterium]HPR47277.1 peptidylprolyl isomerase [Spirochaetota bacterium]